MALEEVDLMTALAAFMVWCIPGFGDMGRMYTEFSWRSFDACARVPRLPYPSFARSDELAWELDVTHTWRIYVQLGHFLSEYRLIEAMSESDSSMSKRVYRDPP